MNGMKTGEECFLCRQWYTKDPTPVSKLIIGKTSPAISSKVGRVVMPASGQTINRRHIGRIIIRHGINIRIDKYFVNSNLPEV